jgi:excisionase family DNA binding protein
MERQVLLTVDEAASRVGLRHVALRKAIRRGELPAIKVCSRLRIEPAALEEWIARCRVQGRAAEPRP